jgi:hypothetical protein
MLSSKQACAEHFNYFIKNLLLVTRDYSMIVATRPEPTVLPPSRNLHLKFHGCSCVFLLILRHFYLVIPPIIYICINSWSRFGASNDNKKTRAGTLKYLYYYITYTTFLCLIKLQFLNHCFMGRFFHSPTLL